MHDEGQIEKHSSIKNPKKQALDRGGALIAGPKERDNTRTNLSLWSQAAWRGSLGRCTWVICALSALERRGNRYSLITDLLVSGLACQLCHSVAECLLATSKESRGH